MNKRSVVWPVVSLIIIWASINTHMILEAGKDSKKITEKNKETEILIKGMVNEIKREYRKSKNLLVNSQKHKDTDFERIFREQRKLKGDGKTFLFNGKKYTTDYSEEK